MCARLAAAAAALIPAGCGFRPLYGRTDGVDPSAELAAVDVLPIDDPELGVALYDELARNLASKASTSKPRYQLAIQINKSAVGQVTERDSRTRRFDLIVSARYALTDRATGSALDKGAVTSVTSYNVVETAIYASRVAEQSAGERAAREVGREIVNRLALYFSRQSAS